jgi:rhamnosyltransferase
MMKKRAAVYIFYDKDGFVDEYVKFFINELKTVADTIIVLVNGDLNQEGKQYFEENAAFLFQRENAGYEMKALEELFLERMDSYFWYSFDELIICNDSFYGPFIPLKEIFGKMESSESDYWGLVRMPQPFFVDFIGSIFVVYRKRIIEGDWIIKYFQENKKYEIGNFFEVVDLYEVGLFYYLKNRGFQSDAMVNLTKSGMKFPYESMLRDGMPVLQRKAFSEEYCNVQEIQKCLSYIKENNLYNVDWITSNARRRYGYSNEVKGSTCEPDKFKTREIDVLNFLTKHTDIYIYGAGRKGKKFWAAYRENIKNFKGFIVSDDQEIKNLHVWDFPVYHYSQVDEGASIIVALSASNLSQVKANLKYKDILILE